MLLIEKGKKQKFPYRRKVNLEGNGKGKIKIKGDVQNALRSLYSLGLSYIKHPLP